jgi:predicted DCC family thiol-disulfide oxidoreductase YuxK
MSAPVKFPVTVFYDRSCAMCASEMTALKALDNQQRFELVDCSTPAFKCEAAADAGVSTDAMMTLIHARDANGRWLIGIECFEELYRAAGMKWAARMLGAPVLRHVLMAIYPWIARNRQLLSRSGANVLIHLIPTNLPARAARFRVDIPLAPQDGTHATVTDGGNPQGRSPAPYQPGATPQERKRG